jgi:tricorn protease
MSPFFQERQPVPAPSFAEPSLSSDGSEIAFASGGDIWTVPIAGGAARLLVAHPAHESRPIYSPDGKNLAFVSTRSGNPDIYMLNFASGDLKRLTFDDGADNLDGWSRDSVWVYFSSTSRDIAGMSDLYRVRASGGTPMQISADRFVSEFFAAPSPDGTRVAFNARGIASNQWWRRGHSHIDESEIWVMGEGARASYTRITEKGAKDIWPMWSPDGKSIYFVSDRTGTENVWVKTNGGAARQITKFTDGRVLWPSIAQDGKTIVFERNFKLWKLDPGNGQTIEIPITRVGVPTGPSVERVTMTNQFSELRLSPDGKKIAFVARGELFAASAKDGGDAMRLTTSPALDHQIAWAPDSKRLIYISNSHGEPMLHMYDFVNRRDTIPGESKGGDADPRFSPDGKLIAFIRNGAELRVWNTENRQESLLAKGYFNRPPFSQERSYAWSPDSKWISYLSASDKSFRNLYVVSVKGPDVATVRGGDAKQLSFLANVFGGSLAWSPDGTFILFNTTQRTETGRIARIDLIPRTPKFREDQFTDLFRVQPASPPTSPSVAPGAPAEIAVKPAIEKKGKDAEPKEVQIVLDGIRRRLSILPVGVDADSVAISPDGKSILMTAGAAGQQNLYVYSIDELSREPAVSRQLTSTPGFKSNAQFSPDGKEVFYLESGRISVVAVESRQVRPLAVTAEMDVDFAKEKMTVFAQASTYLRDYFYDPTFHGVDWGAVGARFAPQIAGSRTPDETRRLLSLMVGELNASHLGVSAPGSTQNTGGRLGMLFDRGEYERDGRLRITEIIDLGPAAITREITAGDYLVAIDGTPIGRESNLDELLAYKANRRVALTVKSGSSGATDREVIVRPVTMGVEKNLLYRQWVNERREYVAKASNGRLGYVHMADMSAGALEQLYVDLDSENHAREGVIVDVRNNSGGFVNAYAIDVFARRGYMNMTVRNQPTTPARTMLGQRALDAPTILVTNQHSLSDAEDFTEGYRALKLGKVVGEPTAGWIIYTSNVTLIDGSSLRIPFIKITDAKGAVMEMNPRPVDVPVTRPIGEGLTGKDSQLDVAVRELLKQLGNGGVATK